jgi:hypothetical protein
MNENNFFLLIILIAVVSILYYYSNVAIVNEKYCGSDQDCACGVSVNTGDCFFGNKNFVDTTRQCPDFCNGIAANLAIVCSNSTCVQRNVAR